MDRARIWPDFRPTWVVYEDTDLLVVNKPVGVSCQAAEPDRPDDLVTRLKRYLTERAVHGDSAPGDAASRDAGASGGARSPARDAYVGVHQRLDRDTSGILAYARRREANASLAIQFERRTVGKKYIACVTGWPEERQEMTLKDSLAPADDGRMRVVRGPFPGAKAAVTHARVIARHADRAMLELSLDTGRTHQARVQLANAGAPIAGDALYGGAPAPRLMLHAGGLALDHPQTRQRLQLESERPPEFEEWLNEGHPGGAIYRDDRAVVRALGRALERRWGLGRGDSGPRATTAFRLVNEDGDGLPGLAIDVYDAWLVAQLHGEEGPFAVGEERERLLDAIHALGFDGVYLKVRPKQANVVDAKRSDVAPPLPVRGAPASEELTILEEGVPFRARLGDGLSTGLFLDQRTNRRRVREMTAGKRVANLFSYTCSFTVAAARGGASGTVSVDAAVGALARGRDNLAAAGVLDETVHKLVADDVFTWLQRAVRKEEKFDWVILDPPSYSTTHRGRFVADSDYVSLAEQALALVAPGGRLLACTNHRGISRARFRRMLHDACRGAKRHPAQLKDLTAGADFPVAIDEEPHMKSVLVTLSD